MEHHGVTVTQKEALLSLLQPNTKHSRRALTPDNQETQAQSFEISKAKRVRSPNHVSIYVNQSEFGITPWDVHIMLGKIQGTTPEGFALEELATVIMSPQHAKAFMYALASNLQIWEDQFGSIQLPQQVVNRAVGLKKADMQTQMSLVSGRAK